VSDLEYATRPQRADGLEFGGAGFVTSVGGAHITSAASANGVAADYKLLTGPKHIQGMATFYKKIHPYKGMFDYFAPGCFSRSLTGKRAIRFHLAHKVEELLGTTADRLEIHGCEEGIAFRLELPDTELGAEVKSEVQSGKLTGMSVGYQIHDSEIKVTGDGDKLR